MEEKILVQSKRCNIGVGLLIFALIATIICGTVFLIPFRNSANEFKNCTRKEYSSSPVCSETDDYKSKCRWHNGGYSSAEDYAFSEHESTFWITFGIAGGLDLICVLIFLGMRSYEMTVTDKRVYGKTAFGKRVDLPMDAVSAVGAKWPKGIAVATSSGKIAFLMIKNRNEIHTCVNELLIARQNKIPMAVKQETSVSSADELKKYKELLDMGAITQEEFDTKKKQLLGL